MIDIYELEEPKTEEGRKWKQAYLELETKCMEYKEERDDYKQRYETLKKFINLR